MTVVQGCNDSTVFHYIPAVLSLCPSRDIIMVTP